MDEKRKPGWAFWTAAAMLMLLAYPVCIGPVFWINERTDAGADLIQKVYVPFLYALPYNGSLERIVYAYIHLGAPKNVLLSEIEFVKGLKAILDSIDADKARKSVIDKMH